MSFDEALKRVLDGAMAELSDLARSDAERARQEGLEAGRAQGWEDGREQGRFEGQEAARQDADALVAAARQEAETRHAALLDEAAARAGAVTDVFGRLLDAFRAIDRARSLSEVLDSAAACAGQEAPRAAVFLVRDGRLRGWRFIGFGKSFDAASFESGLSESGVLADAIKGGTAVGSSEIPGMLMPGDGRAFSHPLQVAGVGVAALYADGFDEPAGPGGVEQRLEAIGRHASRALEALTVLKAARTLVEPAARTSGAEPAAESDDADGSARRYARLLVSEIKLYHEPAVAAGRREGDLTTRLGGEIARARALYEQRVPQAVRVRSDYFRDELVKTLANGDPTLVQLP